MSAILGAAGLARSQVSARGGSCEFSDSIPWCCDRLHDHGDTRKLFVERSEDLGDDGETHHAVDGNERNSFDSIDHAGNDHACNDHACNDHTCNDHNRVSAHDGRLHGHVSSADARRIDVTADRQRRIAIID